MTQTITAPGKPGRPAIGPKAQTHIPQDEMDFLLQEARSLEVPYADVLREVIAAGIAARRGGA
jgi:hypothetical protein